MDKGIGFNRNVYLAWLDAAAAFCAETDDMAQIRSRLEPVIGRTCASAEVRRKAIDVLINIWMKTSTRAPDLRAEAVRQYQASSSADRVWLHYGLTLLYYPFFRRAAASIGQLGRTQETITRAMVRDKLSADVGHLGSLDNAVDRVVFSLRDWGLIAAADKRNSYRPLRGVLQSNTPGLEEWLLACALRAHPAQEIPFADLLHLPELFPFSFRISVDHLRRSPRFAVQRQGVSWDMVRIEEPTRV